MKSHESCFHSSGIVARNRGVLGAKNKVTAAISETDSKSRNDSEKAANIIIFYGARILQY